MTIRAATEADYPHFVRLFGELHIPDPVPTPERFAASFVPVMSVATVDGAVVGFVTWRRYGEIAHVMQVAVDAHVRGQRIGQRLLEHARDAARAAGCTRWYLNVKRDNTPALKLYERVGLSLELEATALKLDFARVPRVDVVDVIAEDDDEIAQRFHLPRERLAMFRARPGFCMIGLRDDAGALVGFAPFDPAHPGTPTLCAVRPDLAPALVEAIRRHADPKFDYVWLTVEGNRALTDALVAMGAELVFELLRLSAPT